VSEQRFTVPVGAADVAGVLHLPDDSTPSPCVIAGHGMGGSKDSDKYLLLGRELPAAGLALARFDRDEVVPPAHGRALFDRARDPRRLHVIAGADHRLTEPGHRREAVEESRRWLLAHLPPAAPAVRMASTGRIR
jgi:fermentation-respiration switch protein FrsA (DUF1100 family)